MSCPTLFRRPALEPLILFEPALDVRQGDIAHGRLGRDLLALIASLFGCWFLLKELGNGGTGEAKVAGRCPLALSPDQDPGANFISQWHGIHLPSSPRLNFFSNIADSWGQWLTFPGSVWPSIMIAFTSRFASSQSTNSPLCSALTLSRNVVISSSSCRISRVSCSASIVSSNDLYVLKGKIAITGFPYRVTITAPGSSAKCSGRQVISF